MIARKGLVQAARVIEQQGRRGDTMLAHINEDEAALLKKLGGSGTRNPRTGLLEFFGGDSENEKDFGSTTDKDAEQSARDIDRANARGQDERNAWDEEDAQVGAAARANMDPDTLRDLGYGADENVMDGRTFGRKALDAVEFGISNKINNFLDRPIQNILDLVVSASPLGAVNTLSGAVTGHTIGSVATATGRAISGNQGTPGSTSVGPGTSITAGGTVSPDQIASGALDGQAPDGSPGDTPISATEDVAAPAGRGLLSGQDLAYIDRQAPRQSPSARFDPDQYKNTREVFDQLTGRIVSVPNT